MTIYRCWSKAIARLNISVVININSTKSVNKKQEFKFCFVSKMQKETRGVTSENETQSGYGELKDEYNSIVVLH